MFAVTDTFMAGWIAGGVEREFVMAMILHYSSLLMTLLGIVVLVATLFITAPYGRYSAGASKGWGVLIPAGISWAIMESPCLYVPALNYLAHVGSSSSGSSSGGELHIWSPPNLILFSMFCMHYINRSIIFPLKMTGGAPAPLSIVLLAMVYCTWNGFNQSTQLMLVHRYPVSWLRDPRFVIGTILFFSGFYINLQSDQILFDLKKRGTSADGTRKYGIPMGGMFTYVTAANYFGEILEWTGFAIACWSLPAFAFAWWTFANLAPRAIQVKLIAAIKYNEWQA